ncbi:MAG: HlyD family efflux transporter periplasmic adaptor subunit [Cyclobacteriaceae bacterium]
MFKRYFFFVIWLGIGLILLVASTLFKDGRQAMVAQVDSQVTAVSFHKPVMISKIHVSPGQEVTKGDLLLEVERPDLAFDLEKLQNDITKLQIRRDGVYAAYRLRRSGLESDFQQKRSALEARKEIMSLESNIDKAEMKQFSEMTGIETNLSADTISAMKIAIVEKELNELTENIQAEKIELHSKFEKDTSLLKAEEVILIKELKILKEESLQLKRYASNSGTIGNVNVQLSELVPPYKTVLSIYDSHPSVIKAYLSERNVSDLKAGDPVMVESTNRMYAVEGVIKELGARVTAYPEMINPMRDVKSYGQEVFVSIPPDNNFLNGEKVFVFLKNE